MHALKSMLKHLLYLFFPVCKDELEVRYKLHSSKDVEVLWSRVSNMADGLLHSVSIRRLENTVSLQVKKTKNKQTMLKEIPFTENCTAWPHCSVFHTQL